MKRLRLIKAIAQLAASALLLKLRGKPIPKD